LKVKKLVFAAFATAFFILIVIYPEQSLGAAKTALENWLSIVVPSLLPFFIANSILMDTGVIKLISSLFEPLTQKVFRCTGYLAYVFISSALSGYPTGAKLTADLYSRGQINEDAAQRMIKSTSISGPAFISAAVCIGMLHAGSLTPYLLIPHYLSAIILTFVLSLRKPRYIEVQKKPSTKGNLYAFFYDNPLYKKNIGNVLSDAVNSSIKTVLSIGGFIVLFSVLLKILETSGLIALPAALLKPVFSLFHIGGDAANPTIAGILEMTAGSLYISSIQLSIRSKLLLLSAIVTFAGLSIHAQTHAIAADAKIRLKGFTWIKIIQALISCGLTALMLAVFNPNLTVFAGNPPADSAYATQISVTILIISLLLVLVLKKLFKSKIA